MNISTAVETTGSHDVQIDVLVRTAAAALEQAKILTDSDDSDKAYVHYLRASEITINLIPHHPEYRAIQTRSPELYKEFAALMMVWPCSASSSSPCVFLAMRVAEYITCTRC